MSTGRAVVFEGSARPLSVQPFELSPPGPGEILVRVGMSTVCGSDLHTWQGKRSAKLPIILGHEIMGTVEALGEGVEADWAGNSLAPGDRITWTIMASCGRCYFCRVKRLPQKCVSLFKYGHESCVGPPHFNGGLAEYLYVLPGTGVFRVPEDLSDQEVAPLNCALSTVVNGVETIGVELGDHVLVQGAGMLGLNAVALAKDCGADTVVCLDADAKRLAMAEAFGADAVIDVAQTEPGEVHRRVKELTGGWGADVAIEVCGVPEAIPQGIELLRIGGRFLVVGAVFPNANFAVDAYSLITKNLTLKGIHNYQPHHLHQALQFVARSRDWLPFAELVTHTFPLEEAERAFEVSASREAIRAAVVPGT